MNLNIRKKKTEIEQLLYSLCLHSHYMLLFFLLHNDVNDHHYYVNDRFLLQLCLHLSFEANLNTFNFY